jgi:hypothetical protein
VQINAIDTFVEIETSVYPGGECERSSKHFGYAAQWLPISDHSFCPRLPGTIEHCHGCLLTHQESDADLAVAARVTSPAQSFTEESTVKRLKLAYLVSHDVLGKCSLYMPRSRRHPINRCTEPTSSECR